MTNIERVRVALSGSPIVGPGVLTLYMASGTAAAGQPAVKTWISNVVQYMAGGVVATVPNTGDVIDDATGALTGGWSAGTVGTYTATDSTGFVGGVGARIKWNTAGVVNGHRVTGSTFIVPIAKSKLTASGGIDTTALAGLATTANTMLGTSGVNFGVWSRPRAARTVGGVTIPAAPGEFVGIASATLAPALTWLRSRRT